MSPPAKKRKTTVTTKKKKKKKPMPTPQSAQILILSEKPQKKPIPTPQSTQILILSEKPTLQSTSIMLLPYDLLLNCIARVSRLYYPTLSLVSKSFRSLVASPELYKVRSLLGRTESCLYVCVWCSSKYRWFTLCRKPDKTLTNEDEEESSKSKYVLATASIPHSSDAKFCSIVAVGSNIYNIGPVSVSILDCRSHTWRKSCSTFRLKRRSFSASALDGKIYVAGMCKDDDGSYKNSVEVFDTKTQTCDPVPIPFGVENGKMGDETVCIDGKLHVVLLNRRVLAYDSKQGTWDEVLSWGISHYTFSRSHCEIGSVLYSAANGAIRWYDTEGSMWRELMGLVGLPELPSRVRLADYGGKMAVFWERIFPHHPYAMTVWCAEIALERCQPSQIWGTVEWFDRVLTSYHNNIVKAVTIFTLYLLQGVFSGNLSTDMSEGSKWNINRSGFCGSKKARGCICVTQVLSLCLRH